LGSNIIISQAEVKRRDAARVELQLFTGQQGNAQIARLPDAFEIRFTAKERDAWTGEAVVLEQNFQWRPLEQVYAATPNFNTEQLNALFAPVEGQEPDEVTLMAEFTWRDLAAPEKWTSTATFRLVVRNDVNRGDEGAPDNVDDITIYVTKAELDAGFVKTTAAQSLTDDQKAFARNNIGALAESEVVKLTAQSVTPTQATQARANIAAASQAAMDAANAAATALALTVDSKANTSSVTALSATVTALDAAVVKRTPQTLSLAEKAQARANIGAAAATTDRVFTRFGAFFNPVGNSTTVSLDGALNTVSGTATARNVSLVGAGKVITGYVGTTITSAAHGGVNGQPCQFTGTLIPAGVVAGGWYYLRDVTLNTFAVAASPGGAAISLSGSFSAWQVLLSVGPFFRHRRIGYRSSGTAGTSCGTRHSVLQWAVSTDPALGRWIYSARFGVSDAAAVANARMFVGLAGRAAAGVLPNGNPSALTNLIGVGADTGDATLHIMHNDDSGLATRIDLGAAFPANTRNTDLYQLVLTCNADLSVTYKVTNLTTAAELSGNLATNLPMPLQLLAPQIWRNNGTTAVSVGIDVVQWSMETAQ